MCITQQYLSVLRHRVSRAFVNDGIEEPRFFRSFYTTFDFSDPAIWVAEASEDCTPGSSRTRSSLLQVNQSALRLPRWIAQAQNSSLHL